MHLETQLAYLIKLAKRLAPRASCFTSGISIVASAVRPGTAGRYVPSSSRHRIQSTRGEPEAVLTYEDSYLKPSLLARDVPPPMTYTYRPSRQPESRSSRWPLGRPRSTTRFGRHWPRFERRPNVREGGRCKGLFELCPEGRGFEVLRRSP